MRNFFKIMDADDAKRQRETALKKNQPAGSKSKGNTDEINQEQQRKEFSYHHSIQQ